MYDNKSYFGKKMASDLSFSGFFVIHFIFCHTQNNLVNKGMEGGEHNAWKTKKQCKKNVTIKFAFG